MVILWEGSTRPLRPLKDLKVCPMESFRALNCRLNVLMRAHDPGMDTFPQGDGSQFQTQDIGMSLA